MRKWRDRQRKEREDWEKVLREEAPKLPSCLAAPTEWNFAAPGYVTQARQPATPPPAEPLSGYRFETEDWVGSANDQIGRVVAEKAVEAIDFALSPPAEEDESPAKKHPRFVRMVGVGDAPKGANPKGRN
jgi:hypothetical protein